VFGFTGEPLHADFTDDVARFYRQLSVALHVQNKRDFTS
jgi:hypothetical protein